MKKLLQIWLLLIVTLLLTEARVTAQPTVTSVTPAMNAINQSASANIVVQFSEAMDQATLTASTIKVYGSFTGYHAGSLSYNAGTYAATINPSTDFDPGELVTVTLTTGITNGSSVALSPAYSWNFTTATPPSGESYTSTNYTVGYGPREVRVADVDNDGDNDLVTVNYDWDNASVLKNNGDGTFAAKSDYPLGDNPTQITVADLNNDGFIDIISTNSFGLSLSVLINNGNGTFAAKVDYSTPYQSRSVIASDVNGDGFLDLLAPTERDDIVSVYLNNGNGTFAADVQYPTGDGPFGITAADLDGDGDQDLITSNYATKTISVLPNLGNGTFGSKTDYSTGEAGRHLTTADVDGDGDADAIVAIISGASSGNIAVLKNNGDGTFAAKVDYTMPFGAFYPTAQDVDGDGDIDILCASSSPGNSVSLLKNNGNGTFAAKVDLVTGFSTFSVAAADLDGNGTIDLATGQSGTNQVTVKLNLVPPAVSSTAPTAQATDAATSGNITITFDQAMFADSLNSRTIRVTGSQSGNHGGSISYNSGTYTATFNPASDFVPGEKVTVVVTTGVQNSQRAAMTSPFAFQFNTVLKGDLLSDKNSKFFPGTKPYGVAHADFDSDGDLDMIFPNAEKDSITILSNDGSGTFTTATTLFTGTSTLPNSLSVADFDGDGDMDFVITQYLSNGISVYLNNGSFSFTSTFYGAQSGTTTSAIGDYDGDGDLDIATFNRMVPSVSVFMNNGDGTFASAANKSVFTGSLNKLRSGDVDNDGDLDLLVGGEHQTVYLLKNNSNGTFSTEVNLGFSSVSDFDLADLNEDGKPDLITVHQTSNKITVSKGNGNGTFASGTDFSFTNPSSVTFMDLGYDGDPDIIVAAQDADLYDEIHYLTNDGTGSFTKEYGFYALQTGYEYSYAGYPVLSTADINGDGDLDLVQTSRLNSYVAIYQSSDFVRVTSFSPAPNAIDVVPSGSISATLNYDANPVTINSTTVTLVGSGAGRIAGSVSYDSPSRMVTFDPASDLKPGQTYMFSVSDSVTSQNGTHLYAGRSTEFTVATAGDGKGHFVLGSTLTFDNGTYPDQSVVGDLNGDGHQDVVATTGYYGTGYVLLNNGDGTFAAPVSLGYSKAYIAHLRLADMDSDGDLDVVIGRSGNSSLDVLSNNGSASFTEAVSYGSFATYYDNLDAKDLSSDGFADLIQRNGGSSGPIFAINNGDWTFNGDIKQIDWSSSDLEITDIDQDGDQDFVMSYNQNGYKRLGIALNERTDNYGYQKFGTPYFIDTDLAPKLIKAADFDADGDVDFVASSTDGLSFFILKNNGNGTFSTQPAVQVELAINSIKVGDLNGDGDLDLVFTSSEHDSNSKTYIMAYYNSGTGTFSNSASFTIPEYYFRSLNLADADSDGDLDFVTIYGGYAGSDFLLKLGVYENGAAVSPATAASSLSSGQNLGSKITLTWTKGDGSRNLVVVKAGSAVDATPVNNANYTAEAEFGSGSDLGGGNYVVYTGGGNSVTLSGLSLNTQYHVAVFTFNGNGGDEVYYTTDAPSATFTTNSKDGYPFETTAGKALSFNGSSSAAEFSYETELPKDITIQMWVKASDSSDVAAFFVRGDSQGISESSGRTIGPDGKRSSDGKDTRKPKLAKTTSGGNAEYYYPIHLGINGGHLYASIYDDDTEDPVTLTGADVVRSNQWYHVALTMHRDSDNYSNGTFYVNGNAVSSYSNVYYNDYEYSFVLGYDGDVYFQGEVDELQIREKVLTTQEIRSGIHTTLSGFPEKVLGYWQFNDGTGTTASQAISSQKFYLQDLSWVTSTIPVGTGATTTTTGVTTGEQTVGNAKLSMGDGFDNPVDVVVSEVTAEPNSWPAGYSSSVGGKYFVIELFGDPGTFSVDLTLNFGPGVLDELVNANPQSMKLYKRSSTSSGVWTDLGGASSADYETGLVTWTGITSFSQFLPVLDVSSLPVELSSFAINHTSGMINLNWSTASESNNAGWEIEQRLTTGQDKGTFKPVGFVAGKGTTTEAQAYSFSISAAKANLAEFRLKQIDTDGKTSYSRILSVDLKPAVFELSQNYPNPFNPTTTIQYSVAKESKVFLTLYNALGQKVKTLVQENQPAGFYSVQLNASDLSSGMYFYVLEAGSFKSVKKLTLLK